MLHSPFHSVSWAHDLVVMLEAGTIPGFALLSHRGEPIAVHGALQQEFPSSAASNTPPAALEVLKLFDARRDAQCTTFMLCGQRQQVFKREDGAIWATTARKRAGSCVYNCGFGLLVVTMRRGQQLQHTLFSQLDALCRRLQK